MTGCGAQQTQVSPALSPTGRPHHPPSVALLTSSRTPRMVERQVWPPAEGPSVGAKALGVPLGSFVDHSPHSRRAAQSWGMSCFFAFCCVGAPQLSQGNWEVCWYYMFPPQKGKHYCCIDAAHSNLFNTNGKGNREKKISGELLGCFRYHL